MKKDLLWGWAVTLLLWFVFTFMFPPTIAWVSEQFGFIQWLILSGSSLLVYLALIPVFYVVGNIGASVIEGLST